MSARVSMAIDVETRKTGTASMWSGLWMETALNGNPVQEAPRWFNPVFHICDPALGKYLSTLELLTNLAFGGIFISIQAAEVCLGQEFTEAFHGGAHTFLCL